MVTVEDMEGSADEFIVVLLKDTLATRKKEWFSAGAVKVPCDVFIALRKAFMSRTVADLTLWRNEGEYVLCFMGAVIERDDSVRFAELFTYPRKGDPRR